VGCIRDIPAPRKKDVEDYLAFVNKHPAEITYEDAAYLDEIDQFDYRFFRLSPKEASLMDPNQRLFLQTAWTTLEDAGYGGQRLVGTRTGVYVGFGGDSEYKKLVAHLDPSSLSLAVTGNLPPIIASRLSYLLDLKGPSMLVNTVCSSSLLAVHLACQGIRNGECHLAIAGGVQTYVLPIRPTKVGIESSDFKTKTFDHSSDGTGSGEGVAAVLLKPLHKALKDRDHIYAVIKGGAVNQDGRSIGISAPNPAAQEDVMVRAWKDANIEPETISYIEAHGTGTKLGDPIEIEGITRAFARYTGKKQFCAIGSVKSNMGHLDNSAGIAGLIKAALALKNKEIPPTLHFNRPNRKIPFHRSPVYVNDILRPWKTNGSPRRCGVSSFSFSGTNCHLVLEEAPEIDKKKGEGKGDWEILTLSAETDSGLERLVAQYKKLVIGKEFNLKDICFTANTGRGLYTHRLALVLTGKTDLQKKIENLDIETLRDSQSLSDGV
jgi:polyketide synthase PksN